ncbi:hypothetical protein AAGC94_21530, partial [Clostridium sporogenes]
NELILSILKDPALIIEGIAQDASDAVDEKGICYSAGYLGGTFFGTKSLDKIAKGVKGLISGGKAATINSLDDIAIYGLNSLDDIIEKAGIKSVDDLTRIGVTSSEDLAKLGVNSVDDLARLGINNIDELSKLGILPEDLSKAGIKGVRQPVSVNANEIRFSQSSVNGADEIISSMKANGWKGDPIDVIKMSDGKLTTIDNTRVVAAREAGIDAKAIIHDANEILPENLIDRFTTKKGVPKTWGEAMELRIGKQKASFRNNNPFGADVMERIGK